MKVSEGKWATLEIKRPPLHIEPWLGEWVTRLRNRNIVLDEKASSDFKLLIAQTWGLRASANLGRPEKFV